MGDPRSNPLRYFVSNNGETKGPFNLDLIDAFILSGHYPEEVRIRGEGSNEWKEHAPVVDMAAPTVQPDSPRFAARIPKWLFWVGGGIGLWFTVKFLIEAGNSQALSRSASVQSPSTSHRSGYSTPSSTPYVTLTESERSKYVQKARGYGLSSSTGLGTPSSSLASTPTTAETPADVIYKGANGKTYRVPHSDYLRLSKQRADIDEEDAAITSLQAKQKTYSDNIELERAYLDRTSQYQIDGFNQKIDRLNLAHAKLKQRIDAFNRSIDAFNAELERVGTLER